MKSGKRRMTVVCAENGATRNDDFDAVAVRWRLWVVVVDIEQSQRPSLGGEGRW